MTLEGWIFMVGLRVFDIGALIVWLIWFFRLRDDDDDADDGRGGGGSAPPRPRRRAATLPREQPAWRARAGAGPCTGQKTVKPPDIM